MEQKVQQQTPQVDTQEKLSWKERLFWWWPRRYKVFISYRWADGAGVAAHMNEILTKVYPQKKVFLDKRIFHSGRFWHIITHALKSTDCFVWLISKESLTSERNPDYYFEELKLALELHLRIVPISLLGDQQVKETDLPECLRNKGFHTFVQVPVSQQDEDFRDRILAAVTGETGEERQKKRVPRVAALAALLTSLLVACCCCLYFQQEGEDRLLAPSSCSAVSVRTQAGPLAQAVDELLVQLPPQQTPYRVGVGFFSYGETGMLTPCSDALRCEVEKALDSQRVVQWLNRQYLNHLEDDNRLPLSELAEPGALWPFGADGADALLRGRYTRKGEQVMVEPELVTPDGIVKHPPFALPLTALIPESSGGAFSVEPQNKALSLEGIQQTTAEAMLRSKRDFRVQLKTVSGERGYAKNDTVSFRIRAEHACHVAVICHQNDGSSVLLFPNAEHNDTFIPADTWVDVPGTQKQGFEIVIGPPFGSDVVQVLACTDRRALAEKLDGVEPLPEEASSSPYKILSRGMMLKKVNDTAGAASAKWGEAHLIISTYP